MRRTGYGFIFAAALAVSVPVFAQKPANAPANASAQCTDGTFSTAKTEKGACSKHGGVKTWFGAAPSTSAKGEAKKEAAPKEAATKKGAAKETAAPAGATASAGTATKGSTGQCSDGSYTRAKTQKGACSQHGGVKTWFATDSPATAPSVPAATPNNAPAAATKNTPAAAPTATPAAPSPAPSAAPAPAPTPKSAPAGKAPASTGKAQVVAKPADAPPDATGKCRDNTYTKSATHTGACSHHGGVAEWYR